MSWDTGAGSSWNESAAAAPAGEDFGGGAPVSGGADAWGGDAGDAGGYGSGAAGGGGGRSGGCFNCGEEG